MAWHYNYKMNNQNNDNIVTKHIMLDPNFHGSTIQGPRAFVDATYSQFMKCDLLLLSRSCALSYSSLFFGIFAGIFMGFLTGFYIHGPVLHVFMFFSWACLWFFCPASTFVALCFMYSKFSMGVFTVFHWIFDFP